MEGFQVADDFLPLLLPSSPLDFLLSPRCHRTVHPRSVTDDLFSWAKSNVLLRAYLGLDVVCGFFCCCCFL